MTPQETIPLRAGEIGAAREEIQTLRERTAALYEAVRSGEINAGQGAILVQISNLQVRILQLESEVLKQELLYPRLEELERQAARRWAS